MSLKYKVEEDLSMVSIKPLNNASRLFLQEDCNIPSWCWLGRTCHLNISMFNSLLPLLGNCDDITLITPEGEFVPQNQNN